MLVCCSCRSRAGGFWNGWTTSLSWWLSGLVQFTGLDFSRLLLHHLYLYNGGRGQTEPDTPTRTTLPHLSFSFSLFLHLTLFFSGKGVKVFCKLPTLFCLLFVCLAWCVPSNPSFHLQSPLDTLLFLFSPSISLFLSLLYLTCLMCKYALFCCLIHNMLHSKILVWIFWILHSYMEFEKSGYSYLCIHDCYSTQVCNCLCDNPMTK